MKSRVLVGLFVWISLLSILISVGLAQRPPTRTPPRTLEPTRTLSQVYVRSASTKSVSLTLGAQPVSVTVYGANLEQIISTQVLLDNTPVEDVKASLGTKSAGSVQVTFTARSTAKPSPNYQLRLVSNTQVINVPATVLSVAVSTPEVLKKAPQEDPEESAQSAPTSGGSGSVFKSSRAATSTGALPTVAPEEAARPVRYVYMEIEGIPGNIPIFEFRVEAKTDVVEYQDGGSPTIRSRPGKTRVSEVILVREVDGFSQNSIHAWRKLTIGGQHEGRSASIICTQESGKEFYRINVYGSWISRIENRLVHHGDKYVLMEEIGITAEGADFIGGER